MIFAPTRKYLQCLLKKVFKGRKSKLAFKSQVHSAFLLKSEDSVKDKE